jgi:hypothetical protein
MKSEPTSRKDAPHTYCQLRYSVSSRGRGAGQTGNLLDDTLLGKAQLKGPSLAAQKELIDEWQVHVPSNLGATG